MSDDPGTAVAGGAEVVDLNLADVDSTAKISPEPQAVSLQAFLGQARFRPISLQQLLVVLRALGGEAADMESLQWASLARKARNKWCRENP